MENEKEVMLPKKAVGIEEVEKILNAYHVEITKCETQLSALRVLEKALASMRDSLVSNNQNEIVL